MVNDHELFPVVCCENDSFNLLGKGVNASAFVVKVERIGDCCNIPVSLAVIQAVEQSLKVLAGVAVMVLV